MAKLPYDFTADLIPWQMHMTVIAAAYKRNLETLLRSAFFI